MQRIRVIPVLLIQNSGLVKTVKFNHPVYVGDPINTLKIFNEKEVDELVILDIDASKQKRKPAIDKIADIASEAFMPLAYGGGITHVDEIKTLFYHGIEKVILNTSALSHPSLITEGAKIFGSQSMVVSIDVKKNLFGKYQVFSHSGIKNARLLPEQFAQRMEQAGAGEIFLTSIDKDGTYTGYDIELIKRVTASVSIPVVACGGARNIEDFYQAVAQGGASAIAAGSMFVFHGKHKAVLINFPEQQELTERLFKKV